MQNVSSSPRISVLVLTKNRLRVVQNCVTSVLRQRYRDYEIVILDDASDAEDTADVVAREFSDSRIRPYRSIDALGVAAGRNFLMERARGEILVSIDDDAVFTRDDALGEVHRCFNRDSSLGAVAFKITNVVGDQRAHLVPFAQFVISREPEIVMRRAFVSSFRGGGHAIPKHIVDELSGYRHDMVFGEEEMDLAYRIIQAGYRITYEPSIEVDHFPMPSVINGPRMNTSSELFYHVRNRAYLAYRYLPWQYAFPYYAIWMLRYAGRGLCDNGMLSFIRGALDTPRFLRGVKRQALDPSAIAYLTKHGGRLWY